MLDEYASQWEPKISVRYRKMRTHARLVELANLGDTDKLRAALDLVAAEESAAAPEARTGASATSAQDAQGRPLLCIAAWRGYVKMVEMLLHAWKEKDPDDQVRRRVFKTSV